MPPGRKEKERGAWGYRRREAVYERQEVEDV